MDLTRRHLLKLSLAITAVAAAMVTGVIRTWAVLREASSESELARALRENFDYLDLPRDVIDRFIRDYEAERGPGSADRPTDSGAIYGHFLLSTDFFQEGARTDRALRYVAYYSPYRSPCYNPLAGFGEG